MQKILAILAIAIVLFSCNAFATKQLVSLHGRATSAGSLINNGNLRAYVFDASSGGTLVYDSGTDFQNTINNGLFDVMLGSGSNELDLNYGQYYWLDIEINGADLDFNGQERKQFESTNGKIQTGSIGSETISNSKIATSAAIDWSKISKTGAQLTELQITTDFNNSFFNQRDANSTFWKQTDLNSWLPTNYYSQTDANNIFWKQTDLNTELTNYPKKGNAETITGNWTINGITTFNNGFGSNGATIENGILYAQSLVLAKDFNSATITGIDINGHHLPSINATWDLGSNAQQWRAIYAQNANFSTITLPNDAISWANLNKTGSTLADLVTRNHNDLQNLQGGTTNEYYHLTATQHTNLTGITGIWKTINASSGSTIADSLADTLSIIGGTSINTTISGDTLTIDYTGSSNDTNWQTSYPTLDTNLALTFYKQSDLNNNNLFIKTSDSNNTSRLDYGVIANPPWSTGSGIDTNVWTAGIIADNNVFNIDLNTLRSIMVTNSAILKKDLNVWQDTNIGRDLNVFRNVNIANDLNVSQNIIVDKNLVVTQTLGAELAPAITVANWTLGAGWGITGTTLDKNADGTGTARPTSAITTTSGITYKVVLVIASMTVGSYATTSVSFGGKSWFIGNTTGTRTYYVTATSNANLIITPGNTDRLVISSVSVKALAAEPTLIANNGLRVNGDIVLTGPSTRILFGHDGDPSQASLRGGDELMSFYQGTTEILRTSSSGIFVASDYYPLRWSDIAMYRTGQGSMAATYYAGPSAFQVYNTYSAITTPANYERLTLTGKTGSSLSITAETTGTGADNLDLNITAAGTGQIKMVSDVNALGNLGTETAFKFKTTTGLSKTLFISDDNGSTCFVDVNGGIVTASSC